MGSKIEDHKCEEQEDGTMICQAEDNEGVCEEVLVPDGHGGFKVKSRAGLPETCDRLEKEVIEQKT